jgi:hypothetical protein
VKQAMTEKQVVQMDDADLAQTVEGLRQLPRKSRPLREVIAYLQVEIRQTLAKGYSYKEMVAFLAERGIAIAEPTLRQYMSNANPAKRAKDPATQEKTPKVYGSYTPDISKKGDSDAGNISNQQSSDTQPIRTVGRFVEMPDEL